MAILQTPRLQNLLPRNACESNPVAAARYLLECSFRKREKDNHQQWRLNTTDGSLGRRNSRLTNNLARVRGGGIEFFREKRERKTQKS